MARRPSRKPGSGGGYIASRKPLALAAGLLVAALVTSVVSCRPAREEHPPGEARSAPAPAGMEDAPVHGPADILRIVRLAANEAPPPELVFTASDLRNRVSPGAADSDGPTLEVPRGESPPVLEIPVDFLAADYACLAVTMRVDGGVETRLEWNSDLVHPEAPGEHAGVALSPGTTRAYTFDLGASMHDTWAGRVTALRLWLSDRPADVEVSEVVLVPRKQGAFEHITLDGRTHEALPGSWEGLVAVPEGAVFHTAVGLSDRAWRHERSEGVVFHVQVEDGAGQSETLAREEVTPVERPDQRAWLPVRRDLGAWAGQVVTLRLTVEHRGNRWGDYAYWGSPMVLGRRDDPGPPPVVLISCDTLRADHVSCYGYERLTTPNLDAFAEDAVLFLDAVTPETSTLTSHMSMFTGLHHRNHGANHLRRVRDDCVTLAEALSEEGYLTAGFTGFKWLLLASYGFARGFDLYDVPREATRDIRTTQAMVEEWLGNHGTGPFFLFFHNYDIHARQGRPPDTRVYGPEDRAFEHYTKTVPRPEALDALPPGVQGGGALLNAANAGLFEITPEVNRYLQASYDDAIRYVDDALGDLFRLLKDMGVYDDAFIIVTADHGEEFGEHGRFNHIQVYRECSRVPLLVKFPRQRHAGRRVESMVQLMDFFPTVLETVGLALDRDIDGRSLTRTLAEKTPPPQEAFISRLRQRALRDATWKLVVDDATDTRELFLLTQDPGQLVDVSGEYPERAREFEARLAAFFGAPEDIWRVHVLGDGENKWELGFRVACESGIKAFETMGDLVSENRGGSLSSSEGGRVTTGHIWAYTEHDQLRLAPVDPTSPVLVTVTSSRPFSFRDASGDVTVRREARIVLDPATWTNAGPPRRDELEALPAVYFEMHGPEPRDPAVESLSPEAIEQLEALGYLAEIESAERRDR